MNTNFKKEIVSPILHHIWLQQSFQIYKIEEGEKGELQHSQVSLPFIATSLPFSRDR